MKCSNCDTSNPADSAFCVNCGAKLGKEKISFKQESPAEHAQKITKNIGSLLKKLSLGEKLIGIGAIVGLINFFLPWVSNPKDIAESMKIPEVMAGKDFGGWVWLLPVLMLVSLGLLYFSQGAVAKTKLKYSSYQILIGTIFATTGIVLKGTVSQVKNWLFQQTIAAAEGYGTMGEVSKELEKVFHFEFGVWLLILASLVIIIGAFLVQRENLKD